MGLPKIGIQVRVITAPELKFAPDGKAVVRFRAKAADRTKGDDGKWVDNDKRTLWLTVKAFGALAENIADKFKVGDPALLYGVEVTEEWQNADGQKRTANVFMADDAGHSYMFPMHQQGQQAHQQGNAPRQGPAPTQPTNAPQQPAGGFEF